MNERPTHLYPNVGVLVDFSQVQHVVQGQHSRRSLGEVQGWVDVVLEKHTPNVRLGGGLVCDDL